MPTKMYYIAFSLIYLLSRLPLCVHYVFSDLIFLILYHVVGYRKKVVRKNLSSSFPDKTQEELSKIERRFYHWFCDYLVETIKMFSLSRKEMRRRMVFDGIEQMNDDLRKGRSVTIFLGHYCNWEWIASLQLSVVPEGKTAQLYHPIENKTMDWLFFYSRGRFGSTSLDMKEAFKVLVDWQKAGIQPVTGFIADQSPGYSSMHYWPQFLNQKTPAYTGGERIARIMDTVVYYFDIHRPRRGYYVAKVVKMCDKPAEIPKFGITEQYYRLLEDSIRRAPEFWLWSHNRWKRGWDDFVEYFPDEHERKRILSKL